MMVEHFFERVCAMVFDVIDSFFTARPVMASGVFPPGGPLPPAEPMAAICSQPGGPEGLVPRSSVQNGFGKPPRAAGGRAGIPHRRAFGYNSSRVWDIAGRLLGGFRKVLR